MTDRHGRGLSSTTVVIEEIEDETDEGSVETTPEDRNRDDLYPLALLKIVMAMKKLEAPDTLHFEDLLDRVLADMVVDREDFTRYVQRNMARLLTAARKGDY